MYTAVLVDDETRSRQILQKLILKYCPEISIGGTSDSVDSAISMINKIKPDIAFLDIQLSNGTGFDILEGTDVPGMSVIFTTAFDQYAIKAFKFSAVDYLLKPIDIDELVAAVKKVTTGAQNELLQTKLQHLINNVRREPEEAPILLISTAESVEFVDVSDIIRCQADGAYCVIHLRDGKRLVASKVIKEFEMLLEGYGFFRVHQSHLVNLRELSRYSRSDNYLLLRDGSKIQLARSRKESFFKELNKLRI